MSSKLNIEVHIAGHRQFPRSRRINSRVETVVVETSSILTTLVILVNPNCIDIGERWIRCLASVCSISCK